MLRPEIHNPGSTLSDAEKPPVLPSRVSPPGRPRQVKTPDVVVCTLTVLFGLAGRISAWLRARADIDGARLAIGHFSRPLDAEECRRLRSAWERSTLPEVEDFEVTAKQVSFLTPPPRVDATWASIDALLAATKLAKAS